MDPGQVWNKVRPEAAVALDRPALIAVVMVAVLIVVVPPVWSVVRLAVTLVHELGHALVGMLAGRRFTGFVVRGDMSGHAVTVGPSRGIGRVVTTWAGYPAPPLVGAALIVLAQRGWAPPVLVTALAVLLIAVLRVRSFLTAAIVVAVGAALGWLWWAGSPLLRAEVLLGVGLVLVVGGWRHLWAVVRHGGASDDPAVLARLTHVPRALWLLSFIIVTAAASYVAAVTLMAS